MRLHECLTLRVKDIDFGNKKILIRCGKGGKDRSTMLPESLRAALQAHLVLRLGLHRCDIQAGAGHVYLPNRLAVKYPSASREFRWQYVFPSAVVRDG